MLNLLWDVIYATSRRLFENYEKIKKLIIFAFWRYAETLFSSLFNKKICSMNWDLGNFIMRKPPSDDYLYSLATSLKSFMKIKMLFLCLSLYVFLGGYTFAYYQYWKRKRYANDVNDKYINDVMNKSQERHTLTLIKRFLGLFAKILQI